MQRVARNLFLQAVSLGPQREESGESSRDAGGVGRACWEPKSTENKCPAASSKGAGHIYIHELGRSRARERKWRASCGGGKAVVRVPVKEVKNL